MTTYTVSYDLVKRKDYPKLWEALEKLNAHRALESLWLVAVTNTAEQLHNHLKQFVDADDRIWVSELTRNHHFSNAKSGTNNWLKTYKPAR